MLRAGDLGSHWSSVIVGESLRNSEQQVLQGDCRNPEPQEEKLGGLQAGTVPVRAIHMASTFWFMWVSPHP